MIAQEQFKAFADEFFRIKTAGRNVPDQEEKNAEEQTNEPEKNQES